MEALITIGAASAFGYSLYNWLQGSIHLYFDTASMLITLVLIGKATETKVRDRVQAQLGAFFALQPAKARIVSEQSPQGRYADARMLASGSIFRAMADEILAADGRVVEGTARLDESSLTGEARPVEKGPGDSVSGGTRVVAGDIRVKATAVGEASMVGQLIAIMEKALENKTGFEDAADRVLRYFVPGIVLLALATGVFCLVFGLGVRESWIRAITVMVISCPCALGVAVPLARVAGISFAGRAGILVHDFSAFERIGKAGAFVFDKTGTLTRGTWDLLEVQALGGRSEPGVLAMAAGLESGAAHSAGEAIVRAAKERGVEPAAAEAVEFFENGISGVIGDRRVKIGAAGFAGDASAGLEEPRGESASAVSGIYLSVDGERAAVFRFGDTLRPSAASLISALKARGIRVSLVSGDGGKTTRIVGESLGISDCHGGMRPREKAAFVDALRAGGSFTAMVGDGVNDVPALASADLAIAVHSGRRIGREASAITLMGNEPRQILDFYYLAARVTRTIRQNLIFSFIYNTVSIPVAMSGLLNPLVAVTAMILSSLSVTGNTLRMSARTRGADEGAG
jgi:heavy metal translocating P-type ATPase